MIPCFKLDFDIIPYGRVKFMNQQAEVSSQVVYILPLTSSIEIVVSMFLKKMYSQNLEVCSRAQGTDSIFRCERKES